MSISAVVIIHYTPHLVEISPYCATQLAGRHDVAPYLLENGATVDIHSAAYLWEIYRWWNGGHRPTGRDATL